MLELSASPSSSGSAASAGVLLASARESNASACEAADQLGAGPAAALIAVCATSSNIVFYTAAEVLLQVTDSALLSRRCSRVVGRAAACIEDAIILKGTGAATKTRIEHACLDRCPPCGSTAEAVLNCKSSVATKVEEASMCFARVSSKYDGMTPYDAVKHCRAFAGQLQAEYKRAPIVLTVCNLAVRHPGLTVEDKRHLAQVPSNSGFLLACEDILV